MAGDPIADIKKELAEISSGLDRLRQAIENSNQRTAASHFQELTTKLEKINNRLEQEFRWLAPCVEEK